MPFQKTVNVKQALGQPGEWYDATPRRVTAYKLETIDSSIHSIGRVFTFDASGKPQRGGTGAFAGILVHPKAYARLGLEPTTMLPQGINAELADMGRLIVSSTAAAAIGDGVQYDTTTGAITGTAPANPGAGMAVIPGATFILFAAEANGLAVIQLNGLVEG